MKHRNLTYQMCNFTVSVVCTNIQCQHVFWQLGCFMTWGLVEHTVVFTFELLGK